MKTKSLKINTVLNVIKQLCSVLFPLITIPYVTRVLQATNYGKVNFGSSIVSYFTLIAAFGITNYSIREGGQIRNNKVKFAQFANEIFTINLLSTFIAYIGLIFVVIISTKIRSYSVLILIQSITIILSTLGANWINTIFEDYLFITLRYIVMQIISIVLLFLFVHTPEDYIIYAIINIIATAGGNLLNIPYIRRYAKLRPTFYHLKKHLTPLFLLFFNEVAFTIYVNSDITILGFLCTDKEVGIYSLSVKIYTVVKTIINSIVAVSMPRMALLLGNNCIDEYKRLCKKVFMATLTILIPAIVGMILLSDKLLYVVAGEEYIVGKGAFSILSIALFFSVGVAFYGNCILIINRLEKVCLKAACLSALLNIILNFVLIPFVGYNGAAFTTLLSEAVTAIIYMKYSKQFVRKVVDKKDLLSVIVGSIAVFIVCSFVNYLKINVYLNISLAIIFSCIVYFVIQIALKNKMVIDFLRSIKRNR